MGVDAVNAPPPAAPPRPSGGAEVGGQASPTSQSERGRREAREGVLVEVTRKDAGDLAGLSGPLKGSPNEGVTGIAAGRHVPGAAWRVNAKQVERPPARVHNVVGQPISEGSGEVEGARPQGGVPGQAREILVAAEATGGQSPQLPGRSPDPSHSGGPTPGLLNHERPPYPP